MKTDILRVNLCLNRSQVERLKALSRKTGKSMSKIIRESLDESLGGSTKNQRLPRFRFVGMGKGGGKNGARDHDRYLYGA